jgi:flavin-dependent dehydrogenase
VRRTDPLIAGGGPAGAAAAIVLARAGGRPLLVERQREPRDIVCGGFMGWDTLAQLDALGIDVMALGARPIRDMRLISGARRIAAHLPHRAVGFSRRALDRAMLDHAVHAGAAIERGVRLRNADGPSQTAVLGDGSELRYDALFLATGKHDLRGLPRLHRRDPASLAIGLRTALTVSPAVQRALEGTIELHLFDGGYAGVLLQEDGHVNLCLSISPERLGGRRAEALIADLAAEAPMLAERYGGASAHSGWSAIAGVPYGWRESRTTAGIFRIGDQAAVIASLAGDGIGMALSSGREAALCYLRDGPIGASAFQTDVARRTAFPLAVAGGLKAVAEQHPRLRSGFLSLFGHAPALAALGARLTRAGTMRNRSARH